VEKVEGDLTSKEGAIGTKIEKPKPLRERRLWLELDISFPS